MTKMIKKKLYCNKCKKYYTVPVLLSTNSYSLEHDASLKAKYKAGRLFQNLCPVCKEKLVDKDYE